jgi:DNA-binding MarR family transcriptional regulator
LSTQEQIFWRRWIDATARVAEAIEHDLKSAADLTFGDYEVLVELSEAPDRRLRMSELAERTVHSPSRISMRVDRLVKTGLVERERCPQDRRGFFAVLTDDGFARLESAAPDHVASVRRHLLDHLERHDIERMSASLSRLCSQRWR